MENKTNMNNVIIPSKRIPIERGEGDSRSGYTKLMYWSDFGAKALVLDKSSDAFMTFVDSSVLVSKSHGYTICILDKDFPTINENCSFVQTMVKNSNFANADKVKFILYKDGKITTPFGVVVEDF